MISVTDALGREVRLARPPERVVSLVPSETESVVELAGVDRLVGRTEYCEEPRGRVEAVPCVGGTKRIDLGAVLALSPELVLANQEENGRRDVERIIAAGIPVHVSFPRTVPESFAYLRSLIALLGLGGEARARARSWEAAITAPAPLARVFVPIWKDPWMTFDRRTYASDLLAHAGAENVFADRARRFPLAADLGAADEQPSADRDTRYPRISLDEIAARAPSIVLLPDEPYAFREEHADELRAAGIGATIELTSGKDLFWYGVRTVAAIARLRALLERPRAR